MQSIYLFCLVFGGLFVFLAAFAGLDGVDFDQDFDTDVELTETSAKPNQLAPRHPPFFWFPFLSLRFWTFGICFFGLVGFGLSAIPAPLSPSTILLLASLVGILCGTVATSILRLLKYRQRDSLIRTEDLVGVIGVVTLPLNAQTRGKVRLHLKGSRLDLMAYTEEPRDFAPGDTVLVVGMQKNGVWVVSENSFPVKNSNIDG